MTLRGLVAATYTPMRKDGSVNTDLFKPMFDFMVEIGVSGFYVCGSTGEGPSLTAEERRLVAEESIRAADGRAPVIVQVGSNSVEEARELAAHAASNGANAISSVPPLYFKPSNAASLVESVAQIASGAPDIPFYYYHIPRLSGVCIDMIGFMKEAREKVPSFAGIKYSDFNLSEFRLCQEFDDGRFDILFGSDEMMLGAVAMGAKGAVGSSYGFAAPLWNRILQAYSDGNTDLALQQQSIATNLVRFLDQNPGPYQAVVKQVVWPELGFDIGCLRSPQTVLTDNEVTKARQALRDSGFLEKIR